MKLQQFKLLKNNITVKGEVEGNESSRKAIVFSHGFGVTRNSHGMFNELGNVLKDKYLVVRFDYSIVNKKENWTKVFPYSIQSKMLQAVHNYVRKEFNPTNVSIIAHSMGCFIIGLAELKDLDKVLLLAPPTTSPYKRLKEYFSKRPETVINEEGISRIKRSDGSITFVGRDVWDEMKTMNPYKSYSDLAKGNSIYIIRALADQVITGESYEKVKSIKGLTYIEIDGNHDFEGKAREVLIKQIKLIFMV